MLKKFLEIPCHLPFSSGLMIFSDLSSDQGLVAPTDSMSNQVFHVNEYAHKRQFRVLSVIMIGILLPLLDCKKKQLKLGALGYNVT